MLGPYNLYAFILKPVIEDSGYTQTRYEKRNFENYIIFINITEPISTVPEYDINLIHRV